MQKCSSLKREGSPLEGGVPHGKEEHVEKLYWEASQGSGAQQACFWAAAAAGGILQKGIASQVKDFSLW